MEEEPWRRNQGRIMEEECLEARIWSLESGSIDFNGWKRGSGGWKGAVRKLEARI